MNKRYIDFVPAKKEGASSKRVPAIDRVPQTRRSLPKEPVETFEEEMPRRARVRGARRELSEEVKPTRSTVTVGRARLVTRTESRATRRSVEKSVEKSPKLVTPEPRRTVTAPRATAIQARSSVPVNPFISSAKEMKRPLSRSVNQKEVKASVEKPQGPETIIDDKEKGGRMGLIITIIITVILGAAAGTVAFLLLPK